MLDDDNSDGGAGFGANFTIDAGGSFSMIARLVDVVESAEGKLVASASRIEKRSTSIVELDGPTAAIKAFAKVAVSDLDQVGAAKRSLDQLFGRALVASTSGPSLTGQAAATTAEINRTELAIEKLIHSYDRETAAIGKNRAERRAAQAEELIGLATKHKNSDAVDRLTASIRALETAQAGEARAQQLASSAAKQAADEHDRLARMVRESHAAQVADAEAAERLRMATDPLYAATSRLNAEIAESTRLYHAGATAPAEHARQQTILTGRLAEAVAAHDKTALAAKRNSGSMMQLSFQLNDVATMAAMGAKPFQIFASQIGQIIQVGQQAEGGMKGLAKEVLGLAGRFWPALVAIGAVTGGFMLFDRAVSKGVDTRAMVAGLGLTRDEIKKLKDVSVSSGDVIKATFQVLAQRVGLNLSEMSKWFGEAMDWMTVKARQSMSALYAGVAGTFGALSVIAKGLKDGKGLDEIMSAVGDNYAAQFEKAEGAMKRFGADVTKQIGSNKLKDLQKQAAELKKDRPEKKDRHAESLARDAEAVEAQIRNLYKLADAYGVSGAAALIAEARVKAETSAIRKRGDIEAMVDRQVRLAIAERVADAAKSAAAMRDEAQIQTEVNAMIADGLIPAERANELLRDRIADLPLLAAIEAAQQRGLKDEVEKATKALEAQQDARTRAAGGAKGAFYAEAGQQAERQLAAQREELKLVGATDMARARGMARIQAIQTLHAQHYDLNDAYAKKYLEDQDALAVGAEKNRQAQDAWNASLGYTAELFDEIDRSAQQAASGMADAFGDVGRTIGDVATIMSGYYADQASLQQAHDAAIRKAGENQLAIAHEQQLFAMRSSSLQVGAYGDMAAAAKGFFKEGSRGYQAMAAAEKIYRVAQMAMSLSAMVQNTLETTTSVANAGARAAADGTAGIAAQAKLPFPLNIAAMAATGAALVAAGIAVAGGFGGGKNDLPKSNAGTGTVLGNGEAQSESLKRSIDDLRDVDTLMLGTSRDMAATLRSIDSQIGGVAALVVRQGNVNADAGVTEGFKTNAIGGFLKATLPVVGGLLSSLFGTKTSVVASGLSAGPQSLGSILDGGFDASYYSDVEKKKKFLGITTGTSYSTQYSAADAGLEQQFTLILRDFNTAIAAAAKPLGEATGTIEQRLAGFVVDLGKIDLKGLTGTEIQEKLSAVFGAAADRMAAAAFPGIERFQKVGEGVFETLVRVSSTVEATTATLAQLGFASRALGIDAKMAIAGQFESLSAMTSAVQGYFERFYSKEEQSAASTAQLRQVFVDLGIVMPSTLAGFRQLVEAQDLTTAAGQATYATLLQLAPAFADLQTSLEGTKSAADILSERRDLQRRILELNGDTAAIRALDLAKVDASNRALQEQIYAIEDAQAAAKAADELRQAWTSVGDSIMDEVRRIRGLTTAGGGGTFAELLGRFNAANAAARGGDMDAAKGLPALSQALLSAAADAATSRQELARVQAATAAQLEATYGVIGALTAPRPTTTTTQITAAAAAQGTPTQDTANGDLISEIKSLREEVAGMRRENNSAQATIAGNTGRTDRRLMQVTEAAGGTAISITNEAAAA